MAKIKTSFFCQNCGSQYAKWQGQCNACKEWNTIIEEVIQKEEKTSWKPTSEVKKVAKLILRAKTLESFRGFTRSINSKNSTKIKIEKGVSFTRISLITQKTFLA